MAIDTTGLPLAKGPTRKQLKRRRDRAEREVKARVRAEVMARDLGHCRLALSAGTEALFGACRGALQWAHWGPYRRSRTRGMPPEERHLRRGGLALCDRHHDDYDEGRLWIEALTPRECDGRLRFANGQGEWEEPA